MPEFPPKTTCRLPGWRPVWLRLMPAGGASDRLDGLRRAAGEQLRHRFPGGKLADDPVVTAVRKLFRAAGTDPTRYRPSSEALARRVLKGNELPAIHPLVDLNNLLSLRLMVPCCVVDPAALHPPFVLRRGEPGESMVSFRGPFTLEGRPVFADREGPFGTPITDAERVRVAGDPSEVWLVAYGVEGAVEPEDVRNAVLALLEAAPVATLSG